MAHPDVAVEHIVDAQRLAAARRRDADARARDLCRRDRRHATGGRVGCVIMARKGSHTREGEGLQGAITTYDGCHLFL